MSDDSVGQAPNRWRYADELSDKIVNLVRDEARQMERDRVGGPYDLLAGQLLALKGFLLTAPVDNRPPWLDALDRTVDLALNGIIKTGG